ncbi:hypothetical protein JOB18_035967 [Solea senegalensis]|uniref:P-selectin glycoprotein ligand 1 n=1 Tax=Solea senegalensis TaxID=28829 RepID=A0AAV6R2J0_SOLSE|nr:P-selectin glycoprotein ligand 1 [Solea senegalensis]KAG7499385.1 hypothetical protein JOB18_035967 [Solea senegalensis]
MKRLSAKACVTLLCGVSVVFATGSKSTSIPETTSNSSNSSTADANELLTAGHNATEMTPVRPSATHKPARDTVTATADTATLHTLETEDGVMRNQSHSSNSNTTDLTTTSSGAGLTAITTVHTSLSNTLAPETNKPTERKSPTTSADTTAPATSSAASTATVTVSSLTSTTTTTADGSTSPLSSSTSASTVATMTTSSTSEETPVFDHTSSSSSSSPPVTSTWTSTTGPKLSSTAQHISETSTHVSTSQSSDTTSSTSTTESSTTNESPTITASETSTISTSAVSTSPVVILVPRIPKRLPIPSTPATQTTSTTTTTTTTTTPCGDPQNPPSSDVVGPCSTRGLVKHCLITIACLAALATIFMVSTIVLCTKLSARKYKLKKPQQATEMMCISALLPERNYNYTRQRSRVTNGVLVIPSGEDSDEEGGDNLTLSSFLPENDRYV